ncbi:hypothetical protein UFOVP1138_41 [uncultured Caudovirales phage]|uniref:Major capsid protein Gp5 n=1 Tax=uncultured Caudovirales phage TaxID=2100421 RepID=A0A6J5QY01_9CAUD|nr:hypothetical protein UFOVP975_80 [uncultured Caudovirales phage]CAB4186251.1 hypothetical protein UFOVP1138_41 [uncultured Caudovirales phage]CAB4204418.1 hypothetical protein UFOVP1394_38 [uncultured Caudovirales phage]
MAVYPVAPGAPDYNSQGSSPYIPAIYSALVIDKFYPSTVWSEISNTKYEGDIKSQGDTVYIRTRATIDTFKYKKGMVLPIQNPESPFLTLKITQGEGFSFAVDKVDEFQADIKIMSMFAEDGAEQQKQVIDKNSLACLCAAANGTPTALTGYDVTDNPISLSSLATAGNAAAQAGQTMLVATGVTTKSTILTSTADDTLATAGPWGSLAVVGTPMSVTARVAGTNVKAAGYTSPGDWIVDRFLYYGQLMDENNVPDAERFIVAPTWVIQRLKSVQSKLGQTYVTGDSSTPTRSGKIGGIDRFKIIQSNNLPSVSTAYPVIFGHKYALTFATQMTESRMVDNPYAFGKLMQALQIYGFQIIKAGFLGVDWLAQ